MHLSLFPLRFPSHSPQLSRVVAHTHLLHTSLEKKCSDIIEGFLLFMLFVKCFNSRLHKWRSSYVLMGKASGLIFEIANHRIQPTAYYLQINQVSHSGFIFQPCKDDSGILLLSGYNSVSDVVQAQRKCKAMEWMILKLIWNRNEVQHWERSVSLIRWIAQGQSG